ncbi:MAG: phospholipid/cholesterol/gamma-HCH transport system substrate-binding protein [Pseudonocardiales bacterium]|jgi:phospholipid/cholesterol/gamma-HCH transport system substrate-binding protein|nr:phospholipid/cholesterol/gamma-HCH transport system substrate-binding protein [Pseudonocardiales bacterium]
MFVVITLVGISYVSAEYVGLTKKIFGSNGCTVTADFPDSGGIFTNAEVTYRGVTVGKVGALRLRPNGVRVDLNLDDCSSNKIPASTSATVADRSVVGEQYVNLQPPNSDGPYLRAGTNIPMSRNKVPTATEKLLVNLDRFVQSVPLNDLRTTVTELGKAFNGRGNDLGSLMDSTNTLLAAATQNLPDTIALINNSATVLSTQLDPQQQGALQSWTHSLNLISQQLKKSDPDIRRLLDNGPADLTTVQNFILTNKTDIGVVLANLTSVGDLIVRHLDGVEQVFVLYPALAAGGPSALRPDKQRPGRNVGALGLVLAAPTKLGTNPDLGNDPPDCGDPKQARQGYNGVRRQAGALGPIAPNVAARCTAPVSSGTNVRGSANVPGGDPISISGGGVAYPRTVTDNTVQIGTSLQNTNLGDGSWLALLTDGLH